MLIARRKNQLTDFTYGAESAVRPGGVVTAITHLRDSIGNSDRITDFLQQRQVRNIVPDKNAICGSHFETRNQFVECGNLVFSDLDHVAHAEFGHALVDCCRLAAADHGNLDAGIKQLAHAETILSRKRFGFDAVVGKIKAAVGKYAVDIESDEASIEQRIVRCRGAHMIPARNKS